MADKVFTEAQASALADPCFTTLDVLRRGVKIETKRGRFVLRSSLNVVLDPFTDEDKQGWWWDHTIFIRRQDGTALDHRLITGAASRHVGAEMLDHGIATTNRMALGRWLPYHEPGHRPVFVREEHYWARYKPVAEDEMTPAMLDRVAMRAMPFPFHQGAGGGAPCHG